VLSTVTRSMAVRTKTNSRHPGRGKKGITWWVQITVEVERWIKEKQRETIEHNTMRQ